MSDLFRYPNRLQILSFPAGYLLCLSASISADQWHPWASGYYSKNTACTVASIKDVETTAESVKVSLEIEPATVSGLLSSKITNRDNWFALHCPSETHEAWRESSASFDVLISAELKPGQTYTLSCAKYLNKQQVRLNRTRKGVLERIKALLQ